MPAQGLERPCCRNHVPCRSKGAGLVGRARRAAVDEDGQVQVLRHLVNGHERRIVQEHVVWAVWRHVDADHGLVLCPAADLLAGLAGVAHAGDNRPLQPVRGLRAEVVDPAVVGAIEGALEADVVEGAVAGHMGGEDDVDVDVGIVHALQAGLVVPANRLVDGAEVAAFRAAEVPAAAGVLQDELSANEAEAVAFAHGVVGDDGGDDGVAAGRNGGADALLGVGVERQLHPREYVSVVGVNVVAVDLGGLLPNVGVHVDHGPAVPGHSAPSDFPAVSSMMHIVARGHDHARQRGTLSRTSGQASTRSGRPFDGLRANGGRGRGIELSSGVIFLEAIAIRER